MWSKEQIWQAFMISVCVGIFLLTVFLCVYLGFYVLFVTLPLLASVIFVDSLFRQMMVTAHGQTEQAQRHVKELSHYITEQERIARVLQKSEEQFRNSFDRAAIGMVLVETESKRILRVNYSFCEIVGRTENELLGLDFLTLVHTEDDDFFETDLVKVRDGQIRTCQIERRICHKQGHALWLLASVSRAFDAENNAQHFIFQVQDITSRKHSEERAVFDALHDALTGLANRALFMDRLRVAFRRAKRHFDVRFAVLYLDFDRFKIINDSLGHLIGDKLLIEVSRRLETVFRASDTVSRLGGDEFAILVEDVSNDDEVLHIAERLQEKLAEPFMLEENEVFITVSVGIAFWQRDYERPDYLLRDADTALYAAKRLGRARYEIFNSDMHTVASHQLQLENDMRYALERNEFVLFYQPIIELSTFHLAGMEALLRWRHPIRGLVSPAEFIPLAEEAGFILPLGQWALRAACHQLRIWQERFEISSDLWVSVNVSGKQFMQNDLVGQVENALNETGLDPTCLKLEITESAMMENVDFAVELLTKIRKFGVKLSIDDFGTGYSSLSHLHRLPLTSLKVDRSFVINMRESEENQEIIKTIINLAQSLKLDIIAEGIESFDQIVRLKDLSCQFGQGYYFAKPLDATSMDDLLIDLHGSRLGDRSIASMQDYARAA